MSVELLDSDRFHGFRVRRQIAGDTFQEYFSLKEDGKRLRGKPRAAVQRRADARDAELAGLQRARRDQARKQVQVVTKGRVRGILCRLKAEKSGNETPVFQIGVLSQVSDKIVNTTVSINRYGTAEAWRKAVEFFAYHKQLNKRSRAYKELLAAEPSPAQVKRMTGYGVKR